VLNLVPETTPLTRRSAYRSVASNRRFTVMPLRDLSNFKLDIQGVRLLCDQPDVVENLLLENPSFRRRGNTCWEEGR